MKISRSETAKVLSLIKYLEKTPESPGFRQPVDHVGLGLFDYLSIVKNPMDLSTVKKNLQEAKYEAIEDAINDLQLIWENCKLYNPPEIKITKDATVLQDLMRAYCTQHSLPLPGAIKKPRPISIPLSEKTILAEMVQNVSNDTLAHIVTVVENECPQAALHIDKNKTMISLDNLTTYVYQKLKNIIEQDQDEPRKKRKIEEEIQE